ncbi:MAG: beta-galactosidase [Isosphaeraceae bacterium]
MNGFGSLVLLPAVLVWNAGAHQAGVASAPPAVVVSDPSLQGRDVQAAVRLAELLRQAGYQPANLSCDEAIAPGWLQPSRCALLALPQTRALPEALRAPVLKYLKAGGHLLALGAPAWAKPLEKAPDGAWLPAGLPYALAPPPHRILDLKTMKPADWVRGSNHPEIKSECSFVTVKALGRQATAIRLRIPRLDGYDTWLGPRMSTNPFPSGNTMTVFSARGGPHTRGLVVEWREKDNSRWIAAVPLSQEWRRFSLPPSAFKSWENSQARRRAGFHPENAAQLSVGLAFSHLGEMGGSHEVWIAEIGTARADQAPPWPRDDPAWAIETLAPASAFYPIHGDVRLRISPEQALIDSTASSIKPPPATISAHPRTSGAGFAMNRPWRWATLIQAEDKISGEWRGAPATVLIHPPGKTFGGGVWAVFTPSDHNFYAQSSVEQAIVGIAGRMRDGLFLVEGGADHFTYFGGQEIRLGATAANLAAPGGPPREAKLSIIVTGSSGEVVARQAWPVSLKQGETATREFRVPAPARWPRDGLRVVTELSEGGKVVDTLSHQIAVWEPPARPSWVTIGPDGHFHKDGRTWRINGVNYMPSSGIALTEGKLFEDWNGAAAYDPEVIERDLTRIERLGLNAVSVFVYRPSLGVQNLQDLLRRCRKHHLMVNLSMRPVVAEELRNHPRDEAVSRAWDTFREIIQRCRLATEDTVFAYDIDWEPAFGSFGRRRGTDADWDKWIKTHYADLAAAERAWGMPVPRTAQGAVTGPSMALLLAEKGPATKMIADYRHFLDDWLEETYGRLARKIHEIAPHQFVSFRMTSTSDPLWERDDLNYQFEGLARGLDFLAPESYGQLGRPDGEAAILFRIALGRAIAPRQPIIWAETGMTIWNPQAQADDLELLKVQGDYYRTFYELACRSGADGIFWWWYPGGFRVGENSDFGLINPDGTDRPATIAVRRDGKRFLACPFPPPPRVQLPYDRDAHPDGVRGVFRELKGAFNKTARSGDVPGLRVSKEHH